MDTPYSYSLKRKGDIQMRLLTTLLVLFTALSFNQIAYSASQGHPINPEINTLQIVNDTEQTEGDDESNEEC